jgi:catechol 2,3-dioxygenase-like lactoylglutathione lyase family enzyme
VDIGRISIQLIVSDLGVTEAFYGGILELPVKRSFAIGGAPEHLTISQNGFDLAFVPEDAVYFMQPELKQGLVEYPKGIGMTLRIRVNEIEDISDALGEEGIDILYPLKAVPYGMKELWCFDPDGYLLALEEPWR